MMAVSPEIKGHIMRYYHVEKWRVHTIASYLHIHRSTVHRVLSEHSVSSTDFLKRNSMIDSFLPFIFETLKKYPSLRASRIYAMVRERGYPGGEDHFRHMISLHRPRRIPEAYLRLKMLPGEQGQVDWGHFGHIMIGTAKRPLMAFVMVLSYSRKIFLHFYLNQKTDHFLQGHVEAFTAWNGVPRVLLYDNLKSAVLERMGDAIRFNPTFLAFAAHYRFEPRPVAVARGNEKGRVERAIQYIRHHFFAARTWKDVDDLNAQAATWCAGAAAERPCPEDLSQSVHTVFLSEQTKLMALPDNPYPTQEEIIVKVGKTPYIRFDLNDYSVPHTHTQCALTVLASPDRIVIQDGRGMTVAEHIRSFDKGQQIENTEHVAALVKQKKQATLHRSQHHLTHAIECGSEFLMKAAEQGYALRSITHELMQLLDDYGAMELSLAMQNSLTNNSAHPHTVRLQLEARRQAQHQLPALTLHLSLDKRLQGQVIKPHNLDLYDQLSNTMGEKK